MLDGIRDFARVGSRDLGHRVRLPNNEQVLHFPNIILSVTLDCAPRGPQVRSTEAGVWRMGLKTYLMTRKSVAYGLCLNKGARTRLLYSAGIVCPGATEPNFMNGDSS
jgi:hypothetical protein